MAIDAKLMIRDACRQLLHPIASMMLKCGLTWKEFSDLSKSVFVQTATADFGIKGRPTNVSRVSILTGISRKEVKRQRDLLSEQEAPKSGKTTDATRVLSGWHQDADFLDDNGFPIALPMSGDVPSFEVLFKRYGGDTPEQTLLKELRNGQAIETDSNGKVIAKSRYYMPAKMAVEDILLFVEHLFDHAQTVHRNVAASVDSEKRYESRAIEEHIDPGAAVEFNQLVEGLGQKLVEEVDDWLSRHRIYPSSSESESVRLGVGVYAIDGHLLRGKNQ